MKKRRLLDLLASRFPEQEKKELHARILCGEVRVMGATERDPKRLVSGDAEIEWLGASFVGRGAEKLLAALDAFKPGVVGETVLDAGSSTGGFTEQLLAHGAALVYAVDVGTNQLAWRLRNDNRVRVMEGTNIAEVRVADLDPPPRFAVCDLSFRSLRGIVPHIGRLTREGRVIALAKPQFERKLARELAEDQLFEGVVADEEGERILRVLEQVLAGEGVRVASRIPSPVRGRRGNREYFLDLFVQTGSGE
ncbi:MAG: TlyA family RNA methyltransferase [Spirochaetota bacterium]